MRDIVKNQREGSPPSRVKKRRRKRNLSLYYLMVFIIVLVVGIVLSVTVLFNIKEIKVSGDTQYDKNEIIKCSNINKGDNLLRTDFKKAEQQILEKLIYIDEVKIHREFPESIKIEVHPSIEYANIQYEKGYLVVSQKGKILEQIDKPKENLITFKGFSTMETKVGQIVSSKDEEKNTLIKKLCNELDKVKYDNIKEIDITDRLNIIMLYDNRIYIELGSENDLEYKLEYTKELVTAKIPKIKKGTLFIRGEKSNEASFVEKTDLDKYEQNYNTATVSKSGESAATTISTSQTVSSSATNQNRTNPSTRIGD